MSVLLEVVLPILQKCRGQNLTQTWIFLGVSGVLVLSSCWAQLFEGRLSWNFNVFLYSFVQKPFQDNFLNSFQSIHASNRGKKIILLNFLPKLSALRSDYILTLGYLIPALNNPAKREDEPVKYVIIQQHKVEYK